MVNNSIKTPEVLTSSFEFERIYKNGRKLHISQWLLVILVSSETEQSYYGITASRKVGSAVVRNKLKRWVRSCAKSDLWPKKFSAKKVVFIFKPQKTDFYKELSFAEFKKTLAEI